MDQIQLDILVLLGNQNGPLYNGPGITGSDLDLNATNTTIALHQSRLIQNIKLSVVTETSLTGEALRIGYISEVKSRLTQARIRTFDTPVSARLLS